MFTDELWRTITPIFSDIVNHPYQQELASGDLHRDCFVYYLQQDALFLVRFGRVMAQLALKASKDIEFTHLLTLAQESLHYERGLFEKFFGVWDIQPARTMGKACQDYCDFLWEAVETRSYGEGLAAVLPCFWVYSELGRNLLHISRTHSNPYEGWISLYAGASYGGTVDMMLSLTNQTAENEDFELRAKMRELFFLSAKYEYFFWDEAYKHRKTDRDLDQDLIALSA